MEIITPEQRDYAIMLIASACTIVTGINDPTLYDSAGVELRASERAAMMARLVRTSYTHARNAGATLTDDQIESYDYLLDLYETRYFEARRYEDQKEREANAKITDVIAGLWDRTHATIH